MIASRDLKVGDILLLKEKDNGFYRHVIVVTDTEENAARYIHWVGMREPFLISEGVLPSAETLVERKLEIECFRLNDHNQALKAVAILQKWLTWAVPFDKTRLQKAEVLANQFFSITSDVLNDKSPEIPKEGISEKLEEHRKQLEALFVNHYMDIVKYAARRDISPVRPKTDEENQTGFHCLQGILTAFQVSFAEEYVNSVTDRWLANKHVIENVNLSNTEPRFENANTALKSNFNKDLFLSSFPLAFRLRAKVCPINTFRHALLADSQKITCLGTLIPLKQDQIKIDAQKTTSERNLFFNTDGKAKRKKLLTDVVIPSMRFPST